MKSKLLILLLGLHYFVSAQTCPAPPDGSASGPVYGFVQLGWEAGGTETQWEVEIVSSEATPTGVGTVVNSNVYNITTLSGGNYKYYVRAICGLDNYSAWHGPEYFSTPVCAPQDQCTYSFHLTDTEGNGWNGNAIYVMQNNYTVGIPLNMATGSEAVISKALCSNEPFELYWSSGGYFPEQIGLEVYNPFGELIYTKLPDYGEQNTVLYDGTASCNPLCYAPVGLHAVIDQGQATLFWEGTATGSWQYYVAPLGQPGPVIETMGIPTNNNPVVVTGLEPDMQYSFYVRNVCTDMNGLPIFGVWSEPADFAIGQYSAITGVVFYDIIGEGCELAGIPLAFVEISVSADGDTFSVFTDAAGQYQIYNLPEGPADVVLQPLLPAGFDIAPVTQTLSTGSIVYAVNFCVPVATNPVNDNMVVLTPVTSAVPGFNSDYQLVVQNIGSAYAENIQATVTYDASRLNFVNNIGATVNGNIITVNMGATNPFIPAYAMLSFNVLQPPVNVGGEELSFTATINGSIEDVNLENNSTELLQTIVNSFDPNDITVHEGPEVAIANEHKDLHYTIRFQNTGTAPAVNIRVENELDANLDWATFQPVAASHNFSATREGNALTFSFNGIYLADSTSNQAASHGFVTYRIKPKADIVEVGDMVNSTAGIFFDFNAPVITNTASTVFTELAGSTEFETGNVVLYPNPVKNVLYINALQSTLLCVYIYDINGRLCITSGNISTVDTHSLSPGLYLVKAITDKGTSNYKLIKQ
jgi:uncharacterized repeat protein (TIGR01451 family)